MKDPEGKYDAACSIARNMTGGMVTALLVLNGNRGTGFAVHALHPDLLKALPDLMERTARDIRAQLEQQK